VNDKGKCLTLSIMSYSSNVTTIHYFQGKSFQFQPPKGEELPLHGYESGIDTYQVQLIISQYVCN
jgi:hypothetical protein